MRLIDMIAGKTSSDPKDQPSGVSITAEPTAGLLVSVDAFAEETGVTREAALLAFAALGAVSRNSIQGMLGALSSRASQIESGAEDLRAQELRLTQAIAKKEGFDEAAKACDEIVSKVGLIPKLGWNEDWNVAYIEGVKGCAAAIRDLKKTVVEQATCDHTPEMDGNIQRRVPTEFESSDPKFVRRICSKCKAIYSVFSIFGPMPDWLKKKHGIE